jgi:phage FluMu protein Com
MDLLIKSSIVVEPKEPKCKEVYNLYKTKNAAPQK